MERTTTELISTRSTVRPKFLYCCNYGKLLRVNLLTGEQSSHTIPAYEFKPDCSWSELPGGSLLITGGHLGVREVVRIDTHREWAICSQPPMHTYRSHHAAVYHSQYLYVLGGYNHGRYLSECERYSCAQSHWEVLPTLLVAGMGMSAVEVENSLYALGGNDEEKYLHTVQKLSLDSLTWELMQLKLPQANHRFPCFKTDTRVYLVIDETLYSFTPLQVKAVKAVKTVPAGIRCFSSYYSRGTLYYEGGSSISSLALGLLIG
jgi:hypothetical protein